MKPELTQARLKELLHYDPETGVFTWRVNSNGRVPAGSLAGSKDRLGYVRIKISRRVYAAHRLAFLYMEGRFPPHFADHVDRNPSNNSWGNLRPATRSQNTVNARLSGKNTSGFRGVHWCRKCGKWAAQGQVYGRRAYLGLFESLEEAAAASQKWREENFGEFAAA